MATARTPFMKNIDRHLLKNQPVTWSTRIHSAGIFGIGFSLFLVLVCFIVPNDPRNYTNIHYWIILIGIISLLAFVFWMIYLLRFNVFKRYGRWKWTDTLKTFLLYFFIIFIIVSWPYIPPLVESLRANNAYSTNELVNDINDMNIGICKLERESIDTRFQPDTFEIAPYKLKSETEVISSSVRPDEPDLPPVYKYYIDSTALRHKLKAADSIQKLKDSVYIIYECPGYRFIYEYDIDAESNDATFSSMELYRRVLQYNQPIDTGKVRADLGKLFTKYSSRHNASTLTAGYYSDPYTYNQTYMGLIRDKYDLELINGALGRIANKKYRWDSETVEVSWRVAYYITLTLSLLVLIYRHSTRKTFFLSILAAVVISIFTSIMIATAGTGTSFFVWAIIYFVLFGIISAFIPNSRTRSVVTGIAFNLLVFMTPFMPLILTGLHYASLRQRYYYTNYYYDRYDYLFRNESMHYLISEIAGALLLVVLLATLYQKAFKKWYALPED